MRSVLVSGAAGVLGSRLVSRLLAAGHSVRALVKPGDPCADRLNGLPCEIRPGELEDPASLTGVFAGVDTVYHLAAVILSPDPTVFERVNRGGTAHMVAGAAAAGVKHFVYVSSASVTYPRLTRYGQSKLAGETLVKSEPRLAHTIVRPTLVYDKQGEREGGQEFVLFQQYLERFPLVPLVGDGRARKRPVWAEDIVDGLTRLAGNRRSHGKTYNFSGADSVTIEELAQLMLARRGLRRRFLHLPVRPAQALAGLLEKIWPEAPFSRQAIAGLIHDADLPPDEAIADLGYRPLALREGLVRSGLASAGAFDFLPARPTGARRSEPENMRKELVT